MSNNTACIILKSSTNKQIFLHLARDPELPEEFRKIAEERVAQFEECCNLICDLNKEMTKDYIPEQERSTILREYLDKFLSLQKHQKKD